MVVGGATGSTSALSPHVRACVPAPSTRSPPPHGRPPSWDLSRPQECPGAHPCPLLLVTLLLSLRTERAEQTAHKPEEKRSEEPAKRQGAAEERNREKAGPGVESRSGFASRVGPHESLRFLRLSFSLCRTSPLSPPHGTNISNAQKHFAKCQILDENRVPRPRAHTSVCLR